MARGYYDSRGNWRVGSPMKLKVTRLKLLAALRKRCDEYKANITKEQERAKAERLNWPIQIAEKIKQAQAGIDEFKKFMVLADKVKDDYDKAVSLFINKRPNSITLSVPDVAKAYTLDASKNLEQLEAVIRRLELSDEINIEGTDVDDYLSWV